MADQRTLDFRILGPIEVREGEDSLLLGAAKQRAVLAILLLHLNWVVSTDDLIEKLWPHELPGRPQTAIQGYVSSLRKALGQATIETTGGGYLLRAEPEQLDANRFDQFVQQGRCQLADGDAEQAERTLTQALNLWRGRPLGDFTYEPWAHDEIARLEELRLVAHEEQIDARLALLRHAELIGELEVLVAEHPLRERPRGQLMVALYRSGRQAEALDAYQQTRAKLLDELGIDPSGELQSLYKQILNQDELLRVEARPPKARTNLPVQRTLLIGRERELREVAALLLREEVRLVTLTGPGGTGKTRLALHAAAESVERYPEGVFFVSLAPVRDPALLMPTIAQALGLREQPGEAVLQTVSSYVRGKSMLLVLDNLEQIGKATPEIAVLLAESPRLNVLATSRGPLRLSGEHLSPVPPLALPDLAHLPVIDALSGYDAVRLFIARAEAARPDFVVTDDNAAAVAEICVRLDGLPLAIELAAARIRVLSPQAMLARLGQRLKLLTGGAQDLDERQRTLRATIEWSYDLLTPEEQRLLVPLGVFVGGCRLDAAEAVCDPDGDLGIEILDGVAALVEQSLLLQREDRDGEPRFWMLETIREYALQAGAVNVMEETRRRHALFFVSLAERVDLESRTGDRSSGLERLDGENANIRAAFAWAREAGETGLMLRLATALWGFWVDRGYLAEGGNVLEEALTRSGERPARALIGLCALRSMTGSSAQELHADAQAALHASQDLGDEFSLAQAWNLVGRVEGSILGAMGRAEQAHAQALVHAERGNFAAEKAESMGWLMISAIFGPLPVPEGISRCKTFFEMAGDDPKVRAFCQVEQAVLEAMSGDFDAARHLLTAGSGTFEELGLKVWAANNAQEVFLVEMLAENPQAASAALRNSYQVLEEMGERNFLSTIAGLLAQALYAQGEYDEAERFSRASEQAAAPYDVMSQVLWRSARAKIMARRGDAQRAEAIAREAIALAEQTEFLNTQADAYLDLSHVLALNGLNEEARAAAAEAAARYERKGNLSALQNLRRS